MWAPFGIPQRPTLAEKLPWHYRVGAHPCDQRWLSSDLLGRRVTATKAFPLRGRWPPEGRSDEVLLRLAVHCPHQSATPTASPRGGSLGLARIAPPHLRRDPTKWSRRIRKNEEADTEFSRLRGNGVQRVHSDAASGSRATAVVRPFGSAPHTHPASPSRKLDLRLDKEERGSGYGASAATRRKRSGACPF